MVEYKDQEVKDNREQIGYTVQYILVFSVLIKRIKS